MQFATFSFIFRICLRGYPGISLMDAVKLYSHKGVEFPQALHTLVVRYGFVLEMLVLHWGACSVSSSDTTQPRKFFPAINFSYYFPILQKFSPAANFLTTFRIWKIFSRAKSFILLFQLTNFSLVSNQIFYITFPIKNIFSSNDFFFKFPIQEIFSNTKFCTSCLFQFTKLSRTKIFLIIFFN